jgi:DNA-binding GntR family transcriptional regulator
VLYRAAGNQQLADAILHYTFATHPIRTRAFPSEELREIAIGEHFAMIDAISRGPTGAAVTGVEQTEVPAPDFRDFRILPTS